MKTADGPPEQDGPGFAPHPSTDRECVNHHCLGAARPGCLSQKPRFDGAASRRPPSAITTQASPPFPMALPLIKISSEEEAQLTQTIEMFEVITQGQPQDYQSLEILKEAYVKLGKEEELIRTSKRIAEAYVLMGQLSSAIMEYESLLHHAPDDPEVKAALQSIEVRAREVSATPTSDDTIIETAPPGRRVASCMDDGQKGMRKAFVDTKVISQQDFDLCWIPPDYNAPPGTITTPFILNLAEKGILPVEQSLKVLLEKSRLGFVPIHRYDTDADVARKFDPNFCRHWCVLPFDRMSKTVLVATANPFNQQALHDLEESKVAQHYLVYVAPPAELMKAIRTTFR